MPLPAICHEIAYRKTKIGFTTASRMDARSAKGVSARYVIRKNLPVAI